MTFFTSDLHLGHRNIIRLCGRPFASLEEMDETLVRRWNRKVGQDDNVFVVGDLFFRAEDPEGLLKRLNGRKTLILGNHDRSWTDTVDLARYFKGVHTMLETSDGAHSLTLCHYPMMTFNHCMRGYMVHGHILGNTDADYFPYLAKHERSGDMGDRGQAPEWKTRLPARHDGAHEGRRFQVPSRHGGTFTSPAYPPAHS